MKFRQVIFKNILVIGGCGASCEISFSWISLNFTDGPGSDLMPPHNKPIPGTEWPRSIWHDQIELKRRKNDYHMQITFVQPVQS